MQALIKLVVALVLVFLAILAIKSFLIPLLPQLALNGLQGVSVQDLIKAFEVVIFVVVVAGIVLQELLHVAPRMWREPVHERPEGARWMDLLYLFAAAFGSSALYIGLAKFAAW